MKRWINFPIFLLQLPFAVRLGLVILVFLLCQLFTALSIPITHSIDILVVPLAMAAWFFRYRGMLLSLFVTMLTTVLIGVFLGHMSFWSSRFNLMALTGLVIQVAIGFMIASLRSMFDVVEKARRKATLAEQQQQRAYEQQQQLIEQKELFMTNVNHEFRSPLTVLYGSLEMLQHSWGDSPPFTDDLQKIWFNRAVESCDSLMLLTNQALSAIFVNHEVPSPHFEEVSVLPVIKDLLEGGDPRLGQLCRFRLEVAEQITVWADREFLSQILWNVLSNAALYCPPDAAITVTVTPFESSAAGTRNQLCIHIKDDGPGIPPEEIPRLFSPFTRLKRDVAKTLPGSGLGLYISKRLIEAMGGKIWVESSGKPGAGSCFYLLLPTVAPVLQA
jgi:signal transduction histidine kinase